MNKKGRAIELVEIKTGKIMSAVTAFDEDGHLFKLTRNQRNLFMSGNGYEYRDILMQVFGNPDILSEKFRLVKDGDVIYRANE